LKRNTDVIGEATRKRERSSNGFQESDAMSMVSAFPIVKHRRMVFHECIKALVGFAYPHHFPSLSKGLHMAITSFAARNNIKIE
jgi:hypothetical protein